MAGVHGNPFHAVAVADFLKVVVEVLQRPQVSAAQVFGLADNHLGRNLDYFAKAALGQGTFPISPAGILQTAAALEAVFKSVDADGAWMAV